MGEEVGWDCEVLLPDNEEGGDIAEFPSWGADSILSTEVVGGNPLLEGCIIPVGTSTRVGAADAVAGVVVVHASESQLVPEMSFVVNVLEKRGMPVLCLLCSTTCEVDCETLMAGDVESGGDGVDLLVVPFIPGCWSVE